MLKSGSLRLVEVGELLLERDGSVIPEQARRLCQLEEHFKELLNHAAAPNTTFSPSSTSAAENYPCEVRPPCLEEVCTAVRQLRNSSRWRGWYPSGGLQDWLGSLSLQLHRVITNVCLCEAFPNNWSAVLLLPLFKKRDKRLYPYYRDISLIGVAAEVFGISFLKRCQSERNRRTRSNQSGFSPG